MSREGCEGVWGGERGSQGLGKWEGRSMGKACRLVSANWRTGGITTTLLQLFPAHPHPHPHPTHVPCCRRDGARLPDRVRRQHAAAGAPHDQQRPV